MLHETSGGSKFSGLSGLLEKRETQPDKTKPIDLANSHFDLRGLGLY